MAKEMKEFKITCQGCQEIRFIPYFEFKEQTKKEKSKGFFADIITSIGLGTACLPLGCCTALGSADGIKSKKQNPRTAKRKIL